MKRKTWKAALPYTLPVFMGYIFLGIAFGVLMVSRGFHPGWAILMSVFVFAGSMQFVAVDILSGPFAPLTAGLMTLMVNARHIFYGLSMLDRFKICGKLKPYMIFSLSDETYSLLCSVEPPEGADKRWFMFFIAAMDQLYWIAGTVIGSLAGSLITFDSTGIDFAMTALFIVIFVEQWESTKNHIPALLGLAVTFICLLIFGSDWFIIAAMAGIFVILSLMRGFMIKKEEALQ
ncbi:MAG: AzlC family ABC transporter permease [Ruminococcus sp.]|jgi:4-azaleucine resistance transporter AzlC